MNPRHPRFLILCLALLHLSKPRLCVGRFWARLVTPGSGGNVLGRGHSEWRSPCPLPQTPPLGHAFSLLTVFFKALASLAYALHQASNCVCGREILGPGRSAMVRWECLSWGGKNCRGGPMCPPENIHVCNRVCGHDCGSPGGRAQMAIAEAACVRQR